MTFSVLSRIKLQFIKHIIRTYTNIVYEQSGWLIWACCYTVISKFYNITFTKLERQKLFRKTWINRKANYMIKRLLYCINSIRKKVWKSISVVLFSLDCRNDYLPKKKTVNNSFSFEFWWIPIPTTLSRNTTVFVSGFVDAEKYTNHKTEISSSIWIELWLFFTKTVYLYTQWVVTFSFLYFEMKFSEFFSRVTSIFIILLSFPHYQNWIIAILPVQTWQVIVDIAKRNDLT